MIAFILTAIVAILVLVFTDTPFINMQLDRTPALATSLVEAWGKGFLSLLELAMHMALILITGSIIASSPPVRKLLIKIANIPNNMFQAVLLVAFIVPLINWFHFGLGIMFGIQLGRQVVLAAKIKKYNLHNPLFVAFLYGCGVTGIGISQIAPIFSQSGYLRTVFFNEMHHLHYVIPEVVTYTESVFLFWNIIMCLAVLVVVFVIMWLLKPKNEELIEEAPDALLIEIQAQNKISLAKPVAATPAEKIDNSIIPGLVIGAFGLVWVARFFIIDKSLDFNSFNILMIIIGVILCGSPSVLIKNVQAAIGSAWGIIILFPFYAGIFGLIMFTGFNDVITGVFEKFATQENWPVLTYVYTSIVNIVIPNSGAKFMVIGPHLIEVATYLVEDESMMSGYIGKILVSYTAGDVATNGFLPFLALPYLAMFKLEFKKIFPYVALASIAAYVIFPAFILFLL